MKQKILLKNCLKKIEEKSCLGVASNWVQRDFEKLSDLIHKETKISLSVSTLRRVWNTDKEFRPQKSTLDALALYIGCKDWHEFIIRCSQLEPDSIEKNKNKNKGILRYRLRLLMVLALGFMLANLLPNPFNLKQTEKIATLSVSESSMGGPMETIDSLYAYLTFAKNDKPKVDAIKELFLHDASIILKTRDNVFMNYSTEGFIKSLTDFSQDEYIKLFGYRALADRSWVFEYGDIAHVYAQYKGVLFGFDQAFNMGFDSFHLIKTRDGWRISSLVGEFYQEGGKLPEFLK